MLNRILLSTFLLLFVTGMIFTQSSHAQDEPSVYYQRLVVDSNGDRLHDSLETTTTFTAFLNNDTDSILTEDTPRWNSDAGNIDLGVTVSNVGVELQNFPHFQAGDTAYLRFTNMAIQEQDTMRQVIDSIPWDNGEIGEKLTLEQRDIPPKPANVQLNVNNSYEHTITWDDQSGLTYRVYRRTFRDTIFSGEPRMLYTVQDSGLTEGSYTDTNTDTSERYAYIVYAVNDNGTWSAHSEEVRNEKEITGFQIAQTKATNVSLSWNDFVPVLGKLAGYNIYRRKEGEGYPSNPISYTGKETEYTDTRLEPGATYYYKLKARDFDLGESGTVDEIKVTTESSTEGTMTYASLKLAVVLYANAPANAPAVSGDVYKMSEGEIQDIKFLIERVREYYWRNTHMRMNLEIDYIIFDEYKELTDTYHKSVRTTGKHLAEDRGVVSTQYDMVFRITPTTGGFWSWGATNKLQLPGPDRKTGFAQMRWPYRDFVIGGFERYPKVYPEIDYDQIGNNLIWTFTHELQHVIDGVYKANGHPEMGHGDVPQLYATTNISNPDIGCCYPGFPESYSKRFGKRFSFQSTMMRDFQAYDGLLSNWGDMYETADNDGDSMPDNDTRVALNESEFGTSTDQADTDSDGYNDLQEAVDGIFEYSHTDPFSADTDGDGTPDGKDDYPRYPMDKRIKTVADGFSPSIDGNLGEWTNNKATLVNDTVSKVERDHSFAPKVYMAYSSDSLYMALDLPAHANPLIRWDFDANGRWYGRGNTTMGINVNNKSFSKFKTWDGSEAARDLDEQLNDKKDGVGNGLWDTNDDYQDEFGGPVFRNSSVKMKVQHTSPGAHIEMAIPRNENANLLLKKGDEIGFHIDYSDLFNQGLGAKTFDWWSYAYVKLRELKATDIESQEEIANTFRLEQNYPNPFNPTTTISYSIKKAGEVRLSVYNMLGRKVSTLVSERKSAGKHEVTFNGGSLSSGIYFYRLKANDKSRVRKMMLLK